MFQLVACHLNVAFSFTNICSEQDVSIGSLLAFSFRNSVLMFQLVACHLNVAFSFTNICSEQDVSIGSLPS